MSYDIHYEGFKIAGEPGRGVEGEQDAGEIDAHGCAVGGTDVCAVHEVGGGGVRLEIHGPGERVEGLRAMEENEESLLLCGAGSGI